ncbi:MAG: hypothetical protein IPP44_25050 [Ideonella sp.]|nr:hypothetical protein [Ideonella sp.]
MGDPSTTEAIRKALKHEIKPAVDKVEVESDKLWNLLVETDHGAEKAIAAQDEEQMKLHEAAYRGCQKRAAVVLTIVDALLDKLHKLEENPAFVEELATFTALTDTLKGIKTMQQNGLADSRDTIARMHKLSQAVRHDTGDLEKQWAVAEAQVAAASKEASAALETMKAARQRAEKAAKAGDAKGLASIKAQSKAFKVPVGPAAIAKLSELAAETLLFFNKSAVDKDALAAFERDAKRLSAKINAAGTDVAATLGLQLEIDNMAISMGVLGPAIAKAMKIAVHDATRVAKVVQDDPGKALAEIEATIKRLKLDLVPKEVIAALKRLGLL